MSLRKKFDITVISASDLPDVGSENSKMQVYAKVSVGNRRRMKKTAMDKDNERNPAWNFIMSFTIDDSAVKQEGVMLVIKLYCKRAGCERDMYIGQVHKSLRELFSELEENSKSRNCELPLQKGSVKSTGNLQFSYRFEDNPVEKRPWWKKLLIRGADEVVGGVVSVAVASICYCCYEEDGEEETGKGTEKGTEEPA